MYMICKPFEIPRTSHSALYVIWVVASAMNLQEKQDYSLRKQLGEQKILPK